MDREQEREIEREIEAHIAKYYWHVATASSTRQSNSSPKMLSGLPWRYI